MMSETEQANHNAENTDIPHQTRALLGLALSRFHLKAQAKVDLRAETQGAFSIGSHCTTVLSVQYPWKSADGVHYKDLLYRRHAIFVILDEELSKSPMSVLESN